MSDNEEQPKEKGKAKEESQYPNMLSWLHWLTESSGDAAADEPQRGKKEKKKAEKSDIDWFTYLKRWPFNSIFPEPPRSETRQRERSRSAPDARGELSHQQHQQQQQQGQQSKSQEEYLELLIHSLPAFIGNVSQARSGECHQQLELLHRQLRAHKLWTLQMLDATGKIGAGLLRGNINQFGDFDQCTRVSTAVKSSSRQPIRVHGKYCLAQIEMRSTTSSLKEALHLLHGRGLWHGHLKNPKHFAPRYNVANWGICLPHGCSAHVVQGIIEASLRPYNDTGIEFHIDARDEHCSTRQRKSFAKLMAKDSYLATGILGIGALGCTCLLALIWEHWDWISAKLRLHSGNGTVEGRAEAGAEANRVEEVEPEQVEEAEEKPTEEQGTETEIEQTQPEQLTPALHVRLLSAFSPRLTFAKLASLDHPDVEFPLIHLLRLLALLLIYVNLKFMMAGHLPITNRDAFVEAVNGYWSLAYRIPLLHGDLLLLLSGFLVAYQLSHEMEQTCRLSFLRNVSAKACRYVPCILAVLGFQAWVLPHLGSGPLWSLLVGENARLCEDNLWRNALSLQNTGDVEEMCSPITIQMSLEVQLYLLGALVVWLYFTDPEAGFFLCGAFHAVSVAARYARTQRDYLAPSLFHGIGISKFYRTGNLIYGSPVARATAYLLGIGAGLLFRSESGSFGIGTRYRRVGWTLAMLGIGWCFWAAAAGMRSKYVYRSTEAAAYLAWSPLILGLGVCWALLMAPLDRSILERHPNIARPVLILSRIQIPLQLATYTVVLWNTASVKEPQQFQVSDLLSLPELLCIVCFALTVAFLIDFPAQQIGYLLLDIIFSDVLLSNSKDNAAAVDSAEPAEADKPDSPEPIESIWSSESEPEEEKSTDK
ncbi:uncharacterized protein LOC6584330 [Drosophila mojavensis]|uniref:Nose resistant-to-fluoxetine protein N-terminal domain-containing protein n=1 Tax=Drosophila mojavensis TaxID=7230 RepID=B4L425_DROMO|nr:uncharacterized protein LOC6584330 [Drosophila mojavensis]EDW07303.2 uncharacterized protein Dmoj_GI15667 [Drosophila mojavensis]